MGIFLVSQAEVWYLRRPGREDCKWIERSTKLFVEVVEGRGQDGRT